MRKSILVALFGLFISMTAMAGHGVERGLVKIDDGGKLESVITKFLTKKLRSCSFGLPNELFKVESVDVTADRVDNGIVDYYYEINLSYDSMKNDGLTNDITVKVLDSDYHNWKDYEEKLSSEISFDRKGHCSK